MSDSKTVAVADTNFSSGAVRSGDRNHLDFAVLPLVGLIGVAKVAGTEGNAKYGRYNYMLGMPVHDLLNHVLGHIVMFLCGDRSEPHLEKGAWGMLVASQSNVLNPELSAEHLLGPGSTVTPAMLAFIAANAPDLAEKRAAGKFEGIGNWDMRDIPEIAILLGQRDAVRSTAETIASEALADAEPVVEKVRKKRRTKAEMLAANAPVESAETSSEPIPLDAEAGPTDAEIAAMDAS